MLSYSARKQRFREELSKFLTTPHTVESVLNFVAAAGAAQRQGVGLSNSDLETIVQEVILNSHNN